MKRLLIISTLTIGVFMLPFIIDSNKTLKNHVNSSFHELRDIKIITSGTKTELWRLEAARAIIDENDIATLFDVNFVSEIKNISVKGKRGIYEINTGNGEIADEVLIKLKDGSLAKIESLRIEKDTLKSNSPVIVEKGNIKITGKGIETDSNGNIKIIKDVKVELK